MAAMDAKRVVLVAEEDETLRNELANQLGDDGYRLVMVEDGLELRDYLEVARHPNALVRWPDVIVSDVSLSGHSGIDLCTWVLAQHEWTPFILLAAREDEESHEAGDRVGATFVLDKPLDMEQLHDAVTVLAGGQLASG